MLKKIGSWFKGHRVLRVLFPSAISLLLVLGMVLPVALAVEETEYLDVTGTYEISRAIPAKYLDGSKHPNIPAGGTLTITTQTEGTGAITLATLTMPWGADIDLDGLVGPGNRPYISLAGSDSAGTFVSINGRVSSKKDTVKGIAGKIEGFITSDGEKWDETNGSSASYTGANAYGGSGYCALLTAGSGQGAVTVIFHNPANSIKLSQLSKWTATTSGLRFYYNLQDTKSPGPQIMLRFAPVGSTTQSYYGGGASGLVDITIMPFQGVTGDGTWKQYVVTKDSAICAYYGNDPVDFHSIDGGFGGEAYTLAEIEAAINDEAVMKGHSASASNWVLTMVDVELWEGGARTCYVDNVMIGKYTYTLEPTKFGGTFKAKMQAVD